MGKSFTYNVFGLSKEEKTETGYRRYECWCMTKLEMVQKMKVMAELGTPIVGWQAQTKTGCKMIGTDLTHYEVPNSSVKHIKTVVCPICSGKGKRHCGDYGIVWGCPVCDGSGITRNGHWNKWRPWQIDNFKAEFAQP